MSCHKERADIRAKGKKPINFTCGKCKQVVPFKDGYKCSNCDELPDQEVEVE